ncbi:hypothetical protein L873DRAFT_1808478 [Choiromyces venosus 120613-1]|uniref:Uncharacterized protein n=1 Tax=Choiromyces venosus 120613-1 TaxID=1336337 RepID=A0A3N4JIZ9_9PEZI|nr:hypothetical protein L873DRAFT_1808478 [Choiromyces venosus 120613-1]
MESLIVRLMPGTPHNNASWSFYFDIGDKVRNIPGHWHFSLGSVRRTAFHSPEQGDGDFKPNNARASEGEWTPLVVGVGYSGSLPALQCDAQ